MFSAIRWPSRDKDSIRFLERTNREKEEKRREGDGVGGFERSSSAFRFPPSFAARSLLSVTHPNYSASFPLRQSNQADKMDLETEKSPGELRRAAG